MPTFKERSSSQLSELGNDLFKFLDTQIKDFMRNEVSVLGTVRGKTVSTVQRAIGAKVNIQDQGRIHFRRWPEERLQFGSGIMKGVQRRKAITFCSVGRLQHRASSNRRYISRHVHARLIACLEVGHAQFGLSITTGQKQQS